MLGAGNKASKRRVSKSQITLYEQERDKVRENLRGIATGYLGGSFNLSSFKEGMQDELKRFYIRTALIAKGKNELTPKDKTDLQKFLALIYGYLDGFVKDLGEYGERRGSKALASDQGVISRASSYGTGWGVFSRFTIPGELADMLPALPGITCLGDGDCGCILEYDSDDEGYNVYWIVNPFKEHCPICIDLAIEWSPYKVTYQEIEEAYGIDALDENGEFV